MFLKRWRRDDDEADDEKAWRAALVDARKQKDDYFRKAPDSPIPADERDDFDGLTYYEPDPAYRLVVQPEHLTDAEPVHIPTSTGDVRTYRPVARLKCSLPEGTTTLTAYEQGDTWFIPFKDATSGKETYGGGRYLEAPGGSADVMIDFNLAYNPYCAYSEAWSCPLPPPDNWLTVPVRAGEQTYAPP